MTLSALMFSAALAGSQLFADCYWDPALWMRRVDRVEPYPWHVEQCAAVTELLRDGCTHIEIAANTCRGAGKTFFDVEMARWFMGTRKGSKGVNTAPAWRHVESVFWPEFRARHKASILEPLGVGTVTLTKWEIEPNWFLEGVSTDTDVNAEGYHSPTGVVLVFDEAKGIRKGVFEALTGTLTSAETLRIYSSTPGFEFGHFYDLWRQPPRPDFLKAHVTGPRAQAEGIVGMDLLEREYRKFSPEAYRSHWLAQFVRHRSGGIILWADVEQALARHAAIVAGKIIPEGPHHSSLDIAASEKGDLSVLGNWIGADLMEVHSWQLRNTREMERAAFMKAKAWGSTRLRGDAPGLGRPVIDGLSEAADRDCPTMRVEEYWEGGKPADSQSLYDDRHSEAVTTLALSLKAGKTALPARTAEGEDIPWAQLLQYRQHPTDDHRYHVVKASRGEKSPDFGDCAVMGIARETVRDVDAWLAYYESTEGKAA
jgi:hypothetical protein